MTPLRRSSASDSSFRARASVAALSGHPFTVRRTPGSWVRLSALRPWLGDLPRGTLDAELDRMIEQNDVQLMGELNQRTLSDEDRRAAVDIGGEPRHLLRIGPA